MLKFIKFLCFITFCIFLISSCNSASKSAVANHSLSSIFGAVESAMTMGIQNYSENHREFYSKPFLISQDESLRKAGFRDRGVAKVFVLGDERPYTIETEVIIQRGKLEKNLRDKDIQYEFLRYDKLLAQRLLGNIISILERRDGNKNLIDDFRPF